MTNARQTGGVNIRTCAGHPSTMPSCSSESVSSLSFSRSISSTWCWAQSQLVKILTLLALFCAQKSEFVSRPRFGMTVKGATNASKSAKTELQLACKSICLGPNLRMQTCEHFTTDISCNPSWWLCRLNNGTNGRRQPRSATTPKFR